MEPVFQFLETSGGDDESNKAADDSRSRDASTAAQQQNIVQIHSTTPRSLTTTRAFSGAVANLCSATLGAGILGLPFAFYQAGVVWASVLLICSAVATYWSLELLTQACELLQTYTYESLTQQALGVSARRVTEFCMLVFCGGCAVAYLVAVGDILEPLLDSTEEHLHTSRRSLAMIFVWCVAMLPLSLLRSMKHLQGASKLGIFAIFTLILSALVHLVVDHEREEGAFHQNDDANASTPRSILWPAHGVTSVIQACPILLFAFSCQVNVTHIYQEFPYKPEFRRVLWSAVGVCAGLYATISLTTLVDMDGSTTIKSIPPNVLQLYCPVGWWNVAFLSMAIAVVVAFPLNVFPARVTLEGLVFPVDHDISVANNTLQQALLLDMQEEEEEIRSLSHGHHDDESNAQQQQQQEREEEDEPRQTTPLLSRPDPHQTRHVLLTIAIAGTALALALVVPNISVVFGLLGGSTSSILGFVLPGWLGVKMDVEGRWRAWVLLVGGLVVAVVTTVVTIYTTLFPAYEATHYPNPCHNVNSTLLDAVWQRR